MKNALIISVNDFLEHDFTLYNKCIFLGETASLVDSFENWDSTVLDITYQHLSFTDLALKFLLKPELILLYCETNQSRMVFRLAELAKKISPVSNILVFGLATTFIPQYFSRFPFSAVHYSGDRESSIRSYINFIDKKVSLDELEGLKIIQNDDTIFTSKKGRWITPSEWTTPKLSKLPLKSYFKFQEKQNNVVDCRLGVSITASKGCQTQCDFCGCSEEEGIIVRTRKPEEIFRWYNDNSNYIDDTFHLYSPNILSEHSWLEDFHSIYTSKKYNFKWQGVTRTNTITDDIIKLASEAGLIKLSIGIEHISCQKQRPIKSSLDELEKAARLCKKHGINLVGLLMLGYPHQTVEDVRYILNILKIFNIESYRFTGYTPLQELSKMSVEQLDKIFIEDYDRRTYYGNCSEISSTEFYEILVSNGKCLMT